MSFQRFKFARPVLRHQGEFLKSGVQPTLKGRATSGDGGSHLLAVLVCHCGGRVELEPSLATCPPVEHGSGEPFAEPFDLTDSLPGHIRRGFNTERAQRSLSGRAHPGYLGGIDEEPLQENVLLSSLGRTSELLELTLFKFPQILVLVVELAQLRLLGLKPLRP